MHNLKNLLAIFLLIISILTGFFLFRTDEAKQFKTSGALKALQFWSAQRAYPNKEMKADGYYNEFLKSKSLYKNSMETSVGEWRAIGPQNIGGRTISLAFNPQNPATIFAGSASGGLWRSYTAGLGAKAWHRVNTGLPVLGVSSIAVSPADSSTIYIGTGEVYNYSNTAGGVTIRETRGSYGIGILKSTDGGISWIKSLDWSADQLQCVWAIRINPLNKNTIWAATTDGTYKSVDAGATWNKVHNIIMANDLQINPADTNMVWVACGNLGSAGKGIYRSTDNGVSFHQLTNGIPSNFNGKIQLNVFQNSPNIIYASIGFGFTSNAGTNLCRSTDYGNNWTTVSTFDYATYQGWFAHFVIVNQNEPDKLIAGGVDLFKSTDGGANFVQKSYWFKWYFEPVNPGEPEGPPDYSHADHHTYAVHPDNPDIIYFGNDGGVFRTTDDGETFEGCNGGYQTTQFYNGFSSSLNDSSLALGGLQDNATAIYNGRLAWNKAIGGDGSWTAINQVDNNYIFGSIYYLRIFKSQDRGFNWTELQTNPAGAGFISPFVISYERPDILYGGSRYVHKSTDGGETWGRVNQNQVLDGNPALAMAAAPNDDNVIYLTTAPVINKAGVFVSTNGGTSFSNVSAGLPDRYPMDIAVDPEDPNTAYVVFSGFGSSHIFKTTNKGANWSDIGLTLPDVPASAVAVDFNNPSHVYFGNDLGVYVSTNKGETWESFSQGIGDAAFVSDLSISPANKSIRCVTHGRGVFERPLLSTVVSSKETTTVVKDFHLYQNYPNPFNPSTTITFDIPSDNNVKIFLFDLLGNRVAELVNKNYAAGHHKINFTASDLAAGVYLYKIEAGSLKSVKKFILLK